MMLEDSPADPGGVWTLLGVHAAVDSASRTPRAYPVVVRGPHRQTKTVLQPRLDHSYDAGGLTCRPWWSLDAAGSACSSRFYFKNPQGLPCGGKRPPQTDQDCSPTQAGPFLSCWRTHLQALVKFGRCWEC